MADRQPRIVASGDALLSAGGVTVGVTFVIYVLGVDRFFGRVFGAMDELGTFHQADDVYLIVPPDKRFLVQLGPPYLDEMGTADFILPEIPELILH